MSEPVDGAGAPRDPFEAREMNARGRVLHRDKVVARKLAAVMFACAVMFTAASVAYALGWGAQVSLLAKTLTFVMTPLFWFTGLLLPVVRVVVTSEEVLIRQGLWGPRIPVRAISRCEVVDRPPKIARSRLFAPGDAKQLVLLEWTDAQGGAQVTVVEAADATVLAAKIEQARAGSGAPVRVQAEEEAVAMEVARGADGEEKSERTP